MNASAQRNSVFQDDRAYYVPPLSVISAFQTSRVKTRVSYPQSDWNVALESRFNDLARLLPGWDGYAGRPASASCVHFAKNLIEQLCVSEVPAPQLVPAGDGTIQIEWHRNQFDLEIVVYGPYDVSATRRSLTTGVVEEIELQTDFSDLTKWISDLRAVPAVEQQVEA